MNLYIQVLTHVQTADVARLLLMPAELQPPSSECKVKIAAGGLHRTRTFGSVDAAISKLEKTKFNEIEFTYPISNKRQFLLSANPVRIVGVLKPSVTSDLWFKTSDWPPDTGRETGLRRINTQASEAAPGAFGIPRMPTAFEFFVELKTREPKEKILDEFAKWIVNSIPDALTPLNVFGCVDAGGPEFFVKFDAGTITTYRIRLLYNVSHTYYPKLGKSFDALHPILFGSRKGLQPIAAALGNYARLITSERNPHLTALRLNHNCDLEVANRRVSKWMLQERSLQEVKVLMRKQYEQSAKMREQYAPKKSRRRMPSNKKTKKSR